MQGSSTPKEVNQTVQVNSATQSQVPSNHIASYFVIAIPILILLGILGHKKYRVTVRRRRIAKLERLWKIDIDEKTY
jgi:hypothetical protein